MWSGSGKTTVVTLSAVLSALVALGAIQYAYADNLVRVAPTSDTITMDAGTTSNALKFKIVKTDANDPAGDDQDGCNAADGTPAKVRIQISPSVGLTAPDPIIVNHCGNPNTTVPLTATIGGTYQVTAIVEDDRTQEPIGSYHVVPFGTVTVTVVDTIPPETTIDSGPPSPTASQSATFTFSSNEAGSSFECSLDDITYSACTSPEEFDNLPVGMNTLYVRATDLSGNTDPTPATYSWEIRAPSITLSASPNNVIWGTPIDAQGTADIVDVSGPSVTLDWGDGNVDSGLAITAGGAWGPVQHEYASGGTFTIIANLTDGVTTRASATFPVTMERHNTALNLVVPTHVTGSTGFLASGVLTDTSLGGVGISGRAIDFSGDGAPASLQTQGVVFNGVLNFVACGIPSDCSPDPAPVNETATSPDNIVLHLGVGGNITFPTTTAQVVLFLQDMGNTPFKYKVIEYPNVVQDCDTSTPAVDECSSAGSSEFIAKVNTLSGFESDGVTKDYNGIKAIVITEVNGNPASGIISIGALMTSTPDTDPTEQHLINFENQAAPSTPTSPLEINAGSYHAIAVAQSDPEPGLTLDAHFAGDTLYNASPVVSASYTVQANLNGFGANFVASGSGTSITEYACTGLSDFDNDGICDEFEDANPPAVFIEALSPTKSWPFPAGETVGSDLPDILYEIDCMTGYCPTQTELNYIEGRFLAQNIRLHLMLDQTNLTVCNPLNVWSDGDANSCNDFRSIKLVNYGTNAERTAAGGNLGQAKPELILKSQAVRYLLFAQNIGTAGGGPTGIAEFKGNDAVVAISSIPAAAADVEETRIGTMLHEIGHNLGLLHGGIDDVNCKPNYISVMNYNRQVPHSKMPVPAANAATGVGWYGDYSHGNILLTNSAGANIGDGKTINEGDLDDGNKLVRTGTWKAFDGVTTVTSFRILWGTPTLATQSQYANTATQLDWDKDVETANDSNQQFDINFLSVTIGGTQLPACTEAPLISTVSAGGDDYVTIKNNIAKFNGASSALLGLSHSAEGNPNSIPEESVEVFNALNAGEYQFFGVENPLTNAGFGESGIATSKQGNTIHVRFNFNDANGTPITGDNMASYGISDGDIILQVAKVTSSEPPSDEAYVPAATSTQGNFADFFTWDGSKWGFQWGTKNLTVGTYAARIYVVQPTGEGVVLDHNGDGISFLVTLVKN